MSKKREKSVMASISQWPNYGQFVGYDFKCALLKPIGHWLGGYQDGYRYIDFLSNLKNSNPNLIQIQGLHSFHLPRTCPIHI